MRVQEKVLWLRYARRRFLTCGINMTTTLMDKAKKEPN